MNAEIMYQVVKTSIMVIFFFIGVAVIPFVKNRILPMIDEIIQSKQYERLQYVVYNAVYAAQQLFGDQLSGADKKEIVRERIQTILQHFSIEWSDEEIDDLIEAAVKQMKNEEA